MDFDFPLPKNWLWVTTTDIQSQEKRATITGPFGSSIGKQYFVEKGVPVIRGNNLTSDITRFVDKGFVFVSESKAKDFEGYKAIAGDIVFTAAGTLGQVGIIPKLSRYPVYIISNKQMRARFDTSKILPEYAFYWFAQPAMVEYIRRQDTGSTIPLINLSVLRSLPIALPPLKEQENIVSTLSALDDKIELNRQMNVTLEAMARAVFKAWFVDFEPVHANVESRPSESASPEIAKLFPSEFEIGIPKGWEVKELNQLFEINPLRSLQKGKNAKYLDMANVPTSGHRVSGWVNRDFSSGTKFKKGDTLLARITPCLENGKTAFVDFLGDEEIGWGSTEFIILRPKNGLPNYFAYLLCRNDDFRNFAIQSMTGTSGRQRVQIDSLGKYQLLVPPEDSLIGEKFGLVLNPIVEKIKQNSEEINYLAQIRDLLLPRLISGKIRVGEIKNDTEVEIG